VERYVKFVDAKDMKKRMIDRHEKHQLRLMLELFGIKCQLRIPMVKPLKE